MENGERRRSRRKERDGVLVCASEVPKERTKWTFGAIEKQRKICHQRSVVAVIDQQRPKVLVDDLIRLVQRLRAPAGPHKHGLPILQSALVTVKAQKWRHP